jgi:formylmethanofuran dehydrogenase subunit C
MKGGSIEVTGNATDWVGGEMSGGLIHIRGNAGGQLGAAYRGGMSGMSGGTILVEGAAGIEIGMRMKRGLIAVRGPVRDFAGLQMKGGTIISLKPLKLMPTFATACDYNPSFLGVYAKHLAAHGFRLPATGEGGYRRHVGDASVPGKGEVLVWHPHAG